MKLFSATTVFLTLLIHTIYQVTEAKKGRQHHIYGRDTRLIDPTANGNVQRAANAPLQTVELVNSPLSLNMNQQTLNTLDQNYYLLFKVAPPTSALPSPSKTVAQPLPPPSASELSCPEITQRYAAKSLTVADCQPVGQSFFYRLSQKGDMSTAREFCTRAGGDLASINNDAEFDDFAKVMKSIPREEVLTSLTWGWVWIGLNCHAQLGDWHWINDNSKANYFKWGVGEPNNRGGLERCAVGYESAGKPAWNDLKCREVLQPVCRMTPTSTLPSPSKTFAQPLPPPSAPELSCQEISQRYAAKSLTVADCQPVGQSFFYRLKQKGDMSTAREFCTRAGGDLAIINNDAEFNAFAKLLKSIPKAEIVSSMTWGWVWIGLNCQAKLGDWHWINDNSKTNYFKWGIGEPNNYGGLERCAVGYEQFGKPAWNDLKCREVLQPVCRMQ